MEINLLESFPRVRRPIAERAQLKLARPAVVALARQFGVDYFDGDRLICYGGYHYDGRWQAVARRMRDHFGLVAGKVLDVGCGKGFLLKDIQELVPRIEVVGIDISTYAIAHAMTDVKPFLLLGNAKALPFRDQSFGLALSINTIHNLPLPKCRQAIRELMRVSLRQFIQVDSWRDEAEYQRLRDWSMTAETFLSTDEWKSLFVELAYNGDWYFTFIEG